MNINMELQFSKDLLTNPNKIFFPEQGITKKDLFSYYYLMADYVLPYLKDRPFVMKRYPDGIGEGSFYQKEISPHAPDWIKSVPIPHENGGRIVNYPVVTDKESLLWLVNQGCIELHAWLSQTENFEHPDIMIIDLDPEPPATFKDSLIVAAVMRNALLKLGLDAWPKTSGSTGVHLFVPIKPKQTFREVTEAAKNLSSLILQVYPEKTTMESKIAKRTGKVYLDYLQNSRGRTMAFPYSIRPHAGAPVSTPLLWEEVENRVILPKDFTIKNIWNRVQKYGDIFSGFFKKSYDIDALLKLGKIH